MAAESDGTITIDTELDKEGFEKGSKEMLSAIQSLTKEINSLGKTMQAVFSQFGKMAQTVNTGMGSMRSSTDSLGKAMDRLGSDIEKMGQTAKAAMDGDEKAIAKFDTQAEAARDTIAQMKERLQAFGNTKIETDDYKGVKEQVAAADKELEKLLDRQAKMEDHNVKKNSASWQNLEKDIEKARQKLATYKSEQADMESSGEAYMTGADTEQYTQAANALTQYEAKLRSMQSQVHGTAQSEEELSASTGGLGSRLRNAASIIGGSMISGLRSMAGAARNAAASLASMVAGGIRNGLRSIASGAAKAASAILGLNKSSKKSGTSLKSMASAMLKYGLSIRSLYMLVRKLKSAITEGFESLAQESDSVNEAISSMKSALTQLKNSFTAAFAPIVTAVAPAITYLINLLSKAMTYVSQFIAALTGSSTYTKAKEVQEDYAESLSDTAEAAEEAQRKTASFDDIEVLSDSSSSSSSSGSSSDSSDYFEEAAIEGSVLDFVSKIKEMFANGDYESIGTAIAEGINSAFAKVQELISWDNVGDTVTQYVNAICGVFNGLVSGINWELIGSTFGEGVNTLVNTADLLITGIDWTNLGTSLADGLNGLVESVDWDKLGTTIGDYFSARIELITSAILEFDWDKAGENLGKCVNSMLESVEDTVDDTDWESVGSSVASGLNSIISTTDFTKLGSTLGSSVNAVLNTINGAVTEFDWEKAGSKIADGINGFFDKVNWSTMGSTLSTSIAGVFDTMTATLENIDWQGLARDVEDFVGGIDWADMADSLFEGIGAAIGGIASFLGTLISDGMTNISDYFTDSIEDAGGNVVLGIFNGITNALSNVAKWINENIFQPFIEGFKKAFGINSPADDPDLVEAAGYVGEGILNSIASVFTNIAEWLNEHILQPIVNWFSNTWLGKLLGFGEDTTAEVDVEGNVDKGKTWNEDAWTAIKSAGETVTKTVQGAVKKASTWVSDAWTAVKMAAGTVTKTVQGAVKKASTWVANAWTAANMDGSTVTKTVQSALKKASTWVANAWTAANMAKSTVTKTVQSALKKASTWVANAWTAANMDGSTVTKTVQSALKKASTWVANAWTAANMAKSTVTKTVQSALKKASTWVANAWTAANMTKTTVTKTVQSAVKKATTWVADAWTAAKQTASTVTRTLQSAVKKKTGSWDSDAFSVLNTVAGTVTKTISLGLDLVGDAWNSLKSLLGFSSGGKISTGGVVSYFASGGKIRDGKSTWWDSVAKYASGTASAHGTVFVAGEAGPEIVGNVNGSTEVLNKSQIAAAIYAAVVDGMSEAVNALGSYLSSRLAECANAIITSMEYLQAQPVAVSQIGDTGILSALQAIASNVVYTEPVLATGTVVPYSVTVDVSGIGDAIEASNSELAQAFTSGMTAASAAIVNAIKAYSGTSVTIDQNSLMQSMVDNINRRTTMFSKSQLKT